MLFDLYLGHNVANLVLPMWLSSKLYTYVGFCMYSVGKWKHYNVACPVTP